MTKKPKKQSFLYFFVGVMGVIILTSILWLLAVQLKPAKDVLSRNFLDIDLSKIPIGESARFNWAGEVIIVRHRTKDEIARAQADDFANLPDPEKDTDRVHRTEWLVISAFCGPFSAMLFDQKGDYDGWFCPGRANHYDTSGRFRKGIDPRNIPAIDHIFITESSIRIEKTIERINNNKKLSLKYM